MEKAYYTLVMDVVLKLKDITLFQKLVLAKLHSLTKNGTCRETNKRLAYLLCTSENQISRAIMRLAKMRYIKVGEDSGRNRIIIPEMMKIKENECTFWVCVTQEDLQSLPLTTAQIFVLKSIKQLDELPRHCFISSNRIADSLAIDPQTVARTLKSLSDIGLISRRHEKGRRIITVHTDMISKLMKDTTEQMQHNRFYIQENALGQVHSPNARTYIKIIPSKSDDGLTKTYTLQHRTFKTQPDSDGTRQKKTAPQSGTKAVPQTDQKQCAKNTNGSMRKIPTGGQRKLQPILKNDSNNDSKKLPKGNLENAQRSRKITTFKTASGKRIPLNSVQGRKKIPSPVQREKIPAHSKPEQASPATQVSPRWSKRIREEEYNSKKGFLPDSQISPVVPKGINIRDIQLYNVLVGLGATRHKTDSKAYQTTMRSIHRMLSIHAENPFARVMFKDANLRAIQKNKFTHDDIVSAFRFHLEQCKLNGKRPCVNISAFIQIPARGDSQSWSPFLLNYMLMNKAVTVKKDSTLSDGAIRLEREFKRINVTLDNRALNFISDKLKTFTDGYSITPALRHIHGDSIISVFGDYVGNLLQNNLTFKVNYIFGDIFFTRFMEDMKMQGVLLQGSYDSIMNSMYGGN